MPTSINSSGITFPNGTTQTTAATGTGTVTSVATGNGLQGGTITSTGTLSVACPAANTVGSYALVSSTNSGAYTLGSNYAVGSGGSQLNACAIYQEQNESVASISPGTGLSGTWKWMGRTISSNNYVAAVGCRVS